MIPRDQGNAMTSPISALVERLTGLLDEATKRPWRTEQDDRERWSVTCQHYSDETPGVCGNHSKAWPLIEEDAELIVEAVNALPALLVALGESRSEGLEEAARWHDERELFFRTSADAERAARKVAWEFISDNYDGNARLHRYAAKKIRSLSSKPSALVGERDALGLAEKEGSDGTTL